MEVLEINKLNYEINLEHQTASIVESPKANGIFSIPSFVQYNNKKYKIFMIKKDAFLKNNIESLSFAKNSEVMIFKENSFNQTTIKKLQIPANLKQLEDGCFFQIKNLVDIEVSPKNNNYSYYNKEFLIGKSQENIKTYDNLIYARYSIKNAVIPSFIKTIKQFAFYDHNELETITVENNSDLEIIENCSLSESLKKLDIPKNFKIFFPKCFEKTKNLIEIIVSTENPTFSWVNDKFLMKKRNEKNNEFYSILFCRRDATEIEIPKTIKEIGQFSFSECNKIETILFESDSSLEIIDKYALSDMCNLKNIVIPPSVKILENFAFAKNENLVSVEILGEEISIKKSCFLFNSKMTSLLIPNAKKIFFENDDLQKEIQIYLKPDCEISFQVDDKNRDQIHFIENEPEKNNNIRSKNEKHVTFDFSNFYNYSPYDDAKIEDNTSKCCILI